MRGGPGYVAFHDGTRLDYDQPLNTLDQRYRSCTEHRTACICREAEWSEEVHEYRAEWEGARTAIAKVIAGHPADVCQCGGCAIAREVHLTHLAFVAGTDG